MSEEEFLEDMKKKLTSHNDGIYSLVGFNDVLAILGILITDAIERRRYKE